MTQEITGSFEVTMDDLNGATPEEVIVDAPVVGAEPEEKSMDDTIRDTLRSLKERGAEVPQETPEEKADRIRDEKGRFAKPVETKQEAPVEAAPVEPAPVVIPPEVQRLGFRKEAAEAYAAAPDVLKQEIQRRSDEWHRGMQAIQPKVQFADAIERVIAPYQQTIKSLNVTPEVAIEALMRADHRLRYSSPADKQAAIFDLARQYGIDMTQQQQPVDPNFSYLQQQLNQTQTWIQQQEAQRQREESERQRAEQEKLNSEIAAFAADPKHSHFESVKGHMAALLQAQQAKDLADAYEQAVYANPTTRAAVLAEQQAAARAEAAKKAQEAKNAASTNVKKRPSLPPSTPIGSMDDTIRATLRNIQARA